ncbi:MAG: aminomethyl-transferring glycine dehydrogenase subunit GcvPA [Gammaproteobacteria bacterium]|nr:aminomethyl-transferring glycine dehydrogenase subunit GcvPA [Gammaproteobacteria bacterium]MYB36569.1 aminomethyl-transferring glycine dehydrogenase subunit GcvPA [Gammaproteobacteria bacterium]
MPFIPHTDQDVATMLDAIGAPAIDDLFDEIPASLRCGPLDVPPGESEMEVTAALTQRARRDEPGPCFLGAGAYDHHIPAAVWDICSRGEYMTAYTPYQAEASQGTLQLIHEFQTMMAALTGMEVANASVYDGASALAESVLMAVRANRRSRRRGVAGAGRETATIRVVVAGAVHPHYVETARNIVQGQGIRLEATGFDASGTVDLARFETLLAEPPAAVIVQQPNCLGLLEPVNEVVAAAHAAGALVIAVANPISLALLAPPGDWHESGADIVCGDGQPLGIPLFSGGPYFGYICTRREFVRQLPGRIVGLTEDTGGQPGYALTLQAREQHIRRGKATSNICTNQGLLVTAATVYMSLLGAAGLNAIASRCHATTRKLVEALTSIDGVQQRFTGPFFHECVLDVGRDAEGVAEQTAAAGITGGLPLGRWYPELANCLLVCATEKRSEADIAAYREVLCRILIHAERPAIGSASEGSR